MLQRAELMYLILTKTGGWILNWGRRKWGTTFQIYRLTTEFFGDAEMQTESQNSLIGFVFAASSL